MWTSPKRMAPFQSSRGMDSASAARGSRMHQRGHAAHGRPLDGLFERRPAHETARFELDRAPQPRRAVERPDHAHVGEALFAGGLGLAVFQDAIGEVEKLRGELVALVESDMARLL